MIRPMIFHHPSCHSLRPLLLIEFLNVKNAAVVVTVIDAEHLESGAVRTGGLDMGEQAPATTRLHSPKGGFLCRFCPVGTGSVATGGWWWVLA